MQSAQSKSSIDLSIGCAAAEVLARLLSCGEPEDLVAFTECANVSLCVHSVCPLGPLSQLSECFLFFLDCRLMLCWLIISDDWSLHTSGKRS